MHTQHMPAMVKTTLTILQDRTMADTRNDATQHLIAIRDDFLRHGMKDCSPWPLIDALQLPMVAEAILRNTQMTDAAMKAVRQSVSREVDMRNLGVYAAAPEARTDIALAIMELFTLETPTEDTRSRVNLISTLQSAAHVVQSTVIRDEFLPCIARRKLRISPSLRRLDECRMAAINVTPPEVLSQLTKDPTEELAVVSARRAFVITLTLPLIADTMMTQGLVRDTDRLIPFLVGHTSIDCLLAE